MKFRFLFLFVLKLSLVSTQVLDSMVVKQVDSLIKVSRAFTDKRDFDKALEINVAAEKLTLEKFGRKSSEFSSCCANYGRVYHHKADYQEAEKWYLEAKDIREKVLGRQHPKYCVVLNNLAIVYGDMGNYEKAERLYLEAYDIFDKVIGKEHPTYAIILNGLSTLYLALGRYEEAEHFCIESKVLKEKSLGKEHPDYAICLNNLALIHEFMGNYKNVELNYLESKAIVEKVRGKEHPDYANSLDLLAGLYQKMGNYEKAEPLFLENKDIVEKVMGKNHPDYAACLQNLGALYSSMGNFEKSEMFYLEAQSIFEKVLGQEHPIYANSLHSLAILYRNMGKLNQAETIALEAMHIREKLLGKEHPDYAESLQDLGTIYEIMGNYEKAEPLYFESKKFFESVVGKEHPKYAVSMSNLAHLYEAQKRFSNSEPLLEEAFTIMHSNLAKATSYLSEQELSKYITAIQKNGDKLSAYLRNRQIDGAHPGILPSLVFDQMLFYKGFLLNAATRLNSTSMLSPQTTEINLSLKAYRRKLSTEYAKPISDRKGVAELEEKANVAEKQLSRLVVGYVDALRPIKWKHVQVKLNKTEAAIEFVSFKLNFPKKYDSIIYAALLLKSGNDPPQFFHLFEEKSLDSLLQSKSERKADYVNTLYSLSDRGVVVVETSKKSIYDIIWKPLEKELSGIKTIYFSPSGLLHRINLDAIPISETETLADKYQLIELNSTRQLVLPTKINTSNNEAVLYGGIQFEQDSILTHSEPILASRSRGELSFHYVDSTLRGGIWNYLPGTEKEVNSIERIMEASGVKTNLIKGYSATEEAFKNIGTNNHSSPRILHIATHGYFFDDPKVQAKSNGLSSQNESVFKISDHPMLRSGLILAGGNAAWQGKQTLEGREDGVLTAYEISQMNLSNTELVVLSACETGLGDIQGNEGVYGLQRAFKIAGAKYLIMSLWQVPDKQTSLLMTTFYKKWLEDKMSIPDAFHAAQKQLRDGGLEPYNWAGFVLVE